MHTTIADYTYSPSSPHDTDAEVRISLELRLPRHAAGQLHDALTGNDKDALLAAERALCAAIDCDDAELHYDASEGDVLEALRNEAAIEERSQRIYGEPIR